jgi:hypothetical protein
MGLRAMRFWGLEPNVAKTLHKNQRFPSWYLRTMQNKNETSPSARLLHITKASFMQPHPLRIARRAVSYIKDL